MKLSRRAVLKYLPLSIAAAWMGWPLHRIAMASEIPGRAIRRELLVANASIGASSLGGATPTSIQNATRFRRDRVLTLAATKELSDKKGVNLSRDDLARIQAYVDELTSRNDSSAVRAVQALLRDSVPDLGKSMDLLATGGGLASVLSSFRHPYVSAGLAIGSLLVPWTDEFLERFYPSLGVIDESAIRTAVSMNDNGAFLDRSLIDEFGNTGSVSVPFGKSNEELVESLPIGLREVARKCLAPSDDSSATFFELLNASDRRLGEVKAAVVASIRNGESGAALRQYWDGEARSGIFLGTTLLRDVLRLPDEARAFETAGSEAYRVWRLVEGFGANPPTVGPLALTGGMVSAGLAIGSVFSGGMSSQEATAKALGQILAAIGVLREEMHDRFDRIERSQKVIIDSLGEVIDSISKGQWQEMERLLTISSSLNGLRNYIESQDRQEKIDAVNLEFDNLALTRHYWAAHLNSPPAMTAVNTIASHAIRTSKQPAFTHSEISQWNTAVVADTIESVGRPDAAISILALARRELGLSNVGEIQNPLEWVRATNAVIEILGEERIPLPEPMVQLLQTLESEGTLLNSRLNGALDRDLNRRCGEQFQLTMRAIELGLKDHYHDFLRQSSATVIYSSEYLGLGTVEYFDAPAVENRIPGSANSYYTGDAIGYFPAGSQRFLELSGQKNPIEAAVSVGLLRVDEVSSSRTVIGSHVVRWDNISLAFLAGKWRGASTSHDKSGNNGILRFTYESQVGLPSYFAVLPRTKLVLASGSSEAMGSKMPNFLEELREEVALHHAVLQDSFLDSIGSFFFRHPAALEPPRAYGSLLRLIFAIDSWGRGASLEFASSILPDRSVTLGTPGSIQSAVKENLPAKIASGEPNEPIVDTAVALIRNAASKATSALAPVAERPPRWFAPIEGTLFKLKGMLQQ